MIEIFLKGRDVYQAGRNKALIFVCVVLFAGAVYALHTDKMKTKWVCRDARLYMDGGIDAYVEAGGLNFHRTIHVKQRHNRSYKDIHSEDVKLGKKGARETYSGGSFQLSVNLDKVNGSRGFVSFLEGETSGEKVSVSMNCVAR